MATEMAVFDTSAKAGNDLSAKQYHFVKLNAADQVDVCNNVGDKPIGVLQNKPTAGHAAQVRVLGVSKVVSDGSSTSIGVWDYVGTDASGKAVKKSADKDFIVGFALDASSADGTVIRVLLTGPFTLSTA